jgi:hypothetical protein
MRKAILIYLLQSLLISLLLATSYFIFVQLGYPQLKSNAVYLLIVFLFIINAGFHIFLVYSSEKSSESFTRRFLASTMIKIFIYILFILLAVFSGITQIKVFLVSFLIFYVTFFIHEISSILQYLKKFNNNRFKSK